MANVAQLVEPRFVVPVVVGSSPIVRPNKKAVRKNCFFYWKKAGRVRGGRNFPEKVFVSGEKLC